MSKGRHKKKKPLGLRLAFAGLALTPFAAGGYLLSTHDFADGEAGKISSVAASLPITPAGRDAAMTDSTDDLCETFEANGQECRITYTYSSEPRGTLLLQSPDEGEEGTVVSLGYSRGPQVVTVPILAGLTVEDAKELSWLSGLGEPKLKNTDAAVAKGTVVRSSRKPSATARNGDGLTLFVSTGLVRVPEWVGKPQELIEAEANELGLKVTFKEVESDQPPGVAVGQERAGKRVPFTRSIAVTIAKDSDAAEEEVPDVVGLTQTEAISLLASRGFLKITTVVAGSNAQDAVVITMTPSAGTSTSTTTEIRLTLDKK